MMPVCLIFVAEIKTKLNPLKITIMKTIRIMMIAVMMTIASCVSAMTYDQAREQALFLTDKMAYELNLSDEQYEAAYEVNLDYLMDVDNPNNIYGGCWSRRNAELEDIFADWQYENYVAASYFYRPIYWADHIWHFGIYARYTNRHDFYRERPTVFMSYRGGNNSNFYASRFGHRADERVFCDRQQGMNSNREMRQNSQNRDFQDRNYSNGDFQYRDNQNRNENRMNRSFDNNNGRNMNERSSFGHRDGGRDNNASNHFSESRTFGG